jgi:serine protease Do
MEEYYCKPTSRDWGWRLFLQLFTAAVLGGVVVLGSLPLLIPHLLPESGDNQFPLLPWNHHEDFEPYSYEHQQTAVVNAVNRVAPAVVGVTRFVQSRDAFRQSTALVPSGVGSGVIISPEGYIVTNYHVIERAAAVVVTLFDGQELEATIVGHDSGTDLAVLKIEPPFPLPVAQIGDSGKLVPGEYAIAIGNPGGLELQQSVSLGIISATDRSLEVYDWVFGLLQTDAAINPGNSGGPLVNLRGEVVGINSVKLLNAEGLGFSIPSNLVKSVIQSLIENGRVIRPMLGVSIRELTPTLAQTYGLDTDYGLYVVIATGPAHQAGIRPEDIIVEIQGVRTKTLRDLRRVLSGKKVGDQVEVTIIRGNTTRAFSVNLADLDAQ